MFTVPVACSDTEMRSIRLHSLVNMFCMLLRINMYYLPFKFNQLLFETKTYRCPQKGL